MVEMGEVGVVEAMAAEAGVEVDVLYMYHYALNLPEIA